MQPSGFPFWGIVLFFLLLFLLSDIYLSKRKTTRSFFRLFRFGTGGDEPGDDGSAPENAEEPYRRRYGKVQLTDLEGLVLMQFARDQGKGLSRKQINAMLHLPPAMFSETLESLAQKGLIRVSLSSLLGIRCHLSAAGRDYLMNEGHIPRILGRTRHPFNP